MVNRDMGDIVNNFGGFYGVLGMAHWGAVVKRIITNIQIVHFHKLFPFLFLKIENISVAKASQCESDHSEVSR